LRVAMDRLGGEVDVFAVEHFRHDATLGRHSPRPIP
jgi:hypothetical protein